MVDNSLFETNIYWYERVDGGDWMGIMGTGPMPGVHSEYDANVNWFGSYSQVTARAAFLRMYLYWTAVFGGSVTVVLQTPLVRVSGTALAGTQ